jgi:preprotein translocase subunit YajC
VLGSLIHLAASGSSSSSGTSFAPLLLILVMGAFFYFALIRPQQRRAKQQRSLIQSIGVGDEVMTIGGIYGTVRGVEDDGFTLEIAPGVDIHVTRTAIARKLVYDEPDGEEEAAEGDEHDSEEADEQS